MATNDSMIQVKNLKKHYHRGAIKALDGVTADINKGDVMVVIGPSGSGKSTLTHAKHGGKYEITLYTSCCNADRGIYYYTTYGNHQITAVDMHRENLDGDRLVRYPLVQGEQIALQN